MNNNLKICIYSQQKTGSTSIYYMLKKNYSVDKRHYNFNAIKNIHYDIIIIPLRKIKEIIISGYFENVRNRKFYIDISKNIKDIITVPIEIHIKNILQYDWNKDNHFSIKCIDITLSKIFKIDITKLKFKNYKIIETKNIFSNKISKIVLCNFIKMNKEEKEKMFNELNLHINNINFHTNIGEKKWYKNIYKNIKLKLKDNNFDNLFDIDFNYKKIKLMGTFKTGTSSIFNLINNSKENNILLQGKHNISLKNVDFDIVIIPVRKQYEIYMSAFFQDITKIKNYYYAYHHNQKFILNEDINKIIKFFLKFDWLKFNHLSSNKSINYLKNIIKENNYKIKLNDDLYYLNEFTHKKTNKKFKVLVIGFCHLNFPQVYKIFKKIGLTINNKFFHINNGKYKWYKNKYIEFCKIIKEKHQDFIEKYKHLDILF